MQLACECAKVHLFFDMTKLFLETKIRFATKVNNRLEDGAEQNRCGNGSSGYTGVTGRERRGTNGAAPRGYRTASPIGRADGAIGDEARGIRMVFGVMNKQKAGL